jgi:uncharacterized protein (TIGR00730 family)
VTPNVYDEQITQAILNLIKQFGEVEDSYETDLIVQLIQTSLKLHVDKHDLGQLKLITRALKEMRYAYRIFSQYAGSQRISIFGSARTPENHPDYQTAKAFSRLMASQGWMCITGAANGIMKAGIEGSQPESSFGLSIKLPSEIASNKVIEGDPKLIIFHYFFTRKLMFMSHSDAVAAFPGGFGTMDEIFEVLTLLQTGKAHTIPVVLLEGPGGHYWDHWEDYLNQQLLTNGWISPDDYSLYYKAPSIEMAAEHIQTFYRNYHSQRYVKDKLVFRLKKELPAPQIQSLNQQFSPLIQSGVIEKSAPFPEDDEFLDLPRIAFSHTRQHYSLLRKMIDAINQF